MLPIPARIFPLPTQTDSNSAGEPEDPIDIFSLSLSSGTLFPDYAITSHGDPGGRIGYTSPTFGDVILDIPKHPDEEGGRGLFAHYLWSAAAIAAAGIEHGSSNLTNGKEESDKKWWDMRDCTVLEVGAGTALPSLLAGLSGAGSIYVTDHPSSPAFTSGSIVSNVRRTLFPSSETQTTRTTSKVKVLPHTWGQLSNPTAVQLKASFDRMIVADCMWLGSQHDNLITSIIHFLKPTPTDPSESESSADLSNPCALIIAGYHTGRPTVSSFFTKATSRGLQIQSIWEIDVGTAASTSSDFSHSSEDLNSMISVEGIPGYRRPWKPERENESKEQSKKWCVVAVLTKPATIDMGVEGHGKEGENINAHPSVWDAALKALNDKVSSIASGGKAVKEDDAEGTEQIRFEFDGRLEIDDVGWI